MNDGGHGTNFWLGNAILALALVLLLNIGALWEQMGPLAMLIWAGLAGLGAYLLMHGKGGNKPNMPD